MVVEKCLGNIYHIGSIMKYDSKERIPVPFEWFEAEKKRISKTAQDGTVFGVCVPELLSDGDVLYETGDKIYVTEIQESRLIKITVSSMKEMGRLCFELGNRHLSLRITEWEVTVPYDEPTYLYLKKAGFHAEDVKGKFTDFIECKAHAAGHSHGHEHAGHNPGGCA